jgi:hypothetical protein
MDMEIELWHCNDVRTHAYTVTELLTLDNCRKRVKVPVWHVSIKHDQYLNAERVEQHLQVAFEHVTIVNSDIKAHAPSIVADERAASKIIPTKLRRMMAKLT